MAQKPATERQKGEVYKGGLYPPGCLPGDEGRFIPAWVPLSGEIKEVLYLPGCLFRVYNGEYTHRGASRVYNEEYTHRGASWGEIMSVYTHLGASRGEDSVIYPPGCLSGCA